MTFRKGESGNPGGKGRDQDKNWRDAVRIAVNDVDPKTGKRKLRLLAEKLVRQGLAGDMVAIKEIGDRLDGKPAQEQHVNVHRYAHEMSDEELLQIARSLSAADDEKIDPSTLN